jgi:surfactin synthase thioesterase subunit
LTTSAKSPWILRPRPRPEARLRLFCFPYAGGGASAFRGWPAALPAEIETLAVQPPGREGRFREAAHRSLPELVAATAEGLAPFLDVPFAFFGHSLGALVGFELARLLRRRGLGPQRLLVSACRAPQRPDPHPPLRGLADADFVREVRRRYDAIPEEIAANAEMLDLLLPTLRADFESFETYDYAALPPLACPISCFGGTGDHFATQAELQDWRAQTAGAFQLRLYDGGHFFAQQHEAALLADVAADLCARPAREGQPAQQAAGN